MTILFVMRSTVYVRNFESTLRLLAARGHDVHIVADWDDDGRDLIDRICRECPRIRYSPTPPLPLNRWSFLGTELRRAIDFLRYLGSEYAHAPKLRGRAERKAPAFVMATVNRPLLGSRPGRWLLSRLLHWCDRALPRDPAIDAFVQAQRPDLVLVTPLVETGSPQAEYLRSARALGVRTGLCVYSWDNLTNKGLIHDPLDIVTVWNEAMRGEAVTLHHVPARSVVVTGAVAYDHWFTWQPHTTRDAFCARVGLSAARPYLLYVCSSKFIAPDEVPFVRDWIARLRGASAVLRDAGVLIRPHPQNSGAWAAADLGDLDNVVVWPRTGANPVDDDSRAEYFDSIHYSAAVVGVNTSAQIEAAIIGRGVYTILAPEFQHTQQGTLHFHHLSADEGGVLHVAHTFPEHVQQLEAALQGGDTDDPRCRRFVAAFVRPHGIDVPATPRLVEALESTAARGRRRADHGPWWGALLRPLLSVAADRQALSQRAGEERRARNWRIKQQRRLDAMAEKQQVHQRRAARRTERKARSAAGRDDLAAAGARAYESYLRVRDWAARMRGIVNGHVMLSDAERQSLAALGHLRNAAPETVAMLRTHTAAAGGACATDYQNPESDLLRRLQRDLHVLRRQLGSELLVQEPAQLGGFGWIKAGERFNADTVRYFEVLGVLKDAAVLGEYRAPRQRRLVWEIGGGWGGFAYHFKTIAPGTTYLITALPDQFLLSAVYLMTMFPDATVRFYDESRSADEFWRDWERVDFMFAPEGVELGASAPPVDLTIDLQALSAMSATRACRHVERAFESGARYFYTLLPTQPSIDETAHVRRALERRFWLHPVPPRTDPEPPSDDLMTLPPFMSDRLHLVGWRRICV